MAFDGLKKALFDDSDKRFRVYMSISKCNTIKIISFEIIFLIIKYLCYNYCNIGDLYEI